MSKQNSEKIQEGAMGLFRSPGPAKVAPAVAAEPESGAPEETKPKRARRRRSDASSIIDKFSRHPRTVMFEELQYRKICEISKETGEKKMDVLYKLLQCAFYYYEKDNGKICVSSEKTSKELFKDYKKFENV